MSTSGVGLANHDFVAQARDLARSVQRGAAALSAALFGDAASSRGGKQFGILMYHRVVDAPPGQPTPTWNVAPAKLREQLAGLLKRGFQAWPLRKVLEYRRRQWSLPPRVFVVTFDDGYENNLTQAFPILSELKIPATIFLATAYLGTDEPLPFDDWAAKGSSEVPADAWRPLSLDQCRELHASGLIELGGHTHTHRDFRQRPNEFRDDLRSCAEYLREQLGLTEATFAFPYGTRRLGFSGPAMARVVRDAGFQCSLTTEAELARVDGDRFDWGRFQVDQGDSPAVLSGKLSGWYGWLRSSGQAALRLLRRGFESQPAAAPLQLGRFR